MVQYGKKNFYNHKWQKKFKHISHIRCKEKIGHILEIRVNPLEILTIKILNFILLRIILNFKATSESSRGIIRFGTVVI